MDGGKRIPGAIPGLSAPSDYDLQRHGPDSSEAVTAVKELDSLVGDLIRFYQSRNVGVVILSEYGLTPAKRVVYPNRALRKKGWLNIKHELGLEYLDCGGSSAFALTDHQIAHVYLNQKTIHSRAKSARKWKKSMVWQVNLREERSQYGLDHERAGDLVCWRRKMLGLLTTTGWMIRWLRTLPAVWMCTENMVTIQQNYLWTRPFRFPPLKLRGN